MNYWSTRGGGDFIAESFGGQGGAGAWGRKSTNLLVGASRLLLGEVGGGGKLFGICSSSFS